KGRIEEGSISVFVPPGKKIIELHTGSFIPEIIISTIADQSVVVELQGRKQRQIEVIRIQRIHIDIILQRSTGHFPDGFIKFGSGKIDRQSGKFIVQFTRNYPMKLPDNLGSVHADDMSVRLLTRQQP